MPGESARRNGRKGGRPKGHHTPWKATLEKEAVRELVRQKITARMEPMIDAQMENAIGIKHCFLRRADGTFERSDDPDAILRALNSGDATSYYIFTKVVTRAMRRVTTSSRKIRACRRSPI